MPPGGGGGSGRGGSGPSIPGAPTPGPVPTPGSRPGGSTTGGGKGSKKGEVLLQINWIAQAPRPRPVLTGSKVAKKTGPHELLPKWKVARDAFAPALIYFYSVKKKSREAKTCTKLNDRVWNYQPLVKTSRYFACYAIDHDKLHKSIRIQFRMTKSPGILLLDCFGKVLRRYNGTACISLLGSMLNGSMKTIIKRNNYAVKKFKKSVAAKKMFAEDLERAFKDAEEMLEEGRFAEARAIFDKISKINFDKELTKKAGHLIDEIDTGLLYFKAVEALNKGLFDEAEKGLRAVEAAHSERYSVRASDLIEVFPAARLYAAATKDLKDGKTYPAMQKFEKVIAMENAGPFKAKAEASLKKIREGWNKKIK